jgi:uncharacterized metal-binding protein (TIGR02443 family)
MARRFIAGAVCPRCGEMDKIVVDTESDQRECVSCGFNEARPSDNSAPKPLEPRTRVNRPASRRVETTAEVITLVPDSKKPKK